MGSGLDSYTRDASVEQDKGVHSNGYDWMREGKARGQCDVLLKEDDGSGAWDC